MTLLDRGTWNPTLLAPPPSPPAVVVPLSPTPGYLGDPVEAPGGPAWDTAHDEPEDPVLPPFTGARALARPRIEALLSDAGRDPADALRELGDWLGVPGWDGVSAVAFGRPSWTLRGAPWTLGDAPDAAVLYVPGPAPAPGDPAAMVLAFRRALQALRRARGTLTRQDERDLIVRLLLSLSIVREEHA
jgi:hypothetical protein